MPKKHNQFLIEVLILSILLISACGRLRQQPPEPQLPEELKAKYSQVMEILNQKESEGYDISSVKEDVERAKQLAAEGNMA